MIKPTVGRMVWFWPHGVMAGPPENYEPSLIGTAQGAQPFAAVVTHCISDTVVNLMVFPPEGLPYPEQGVRLRQPEEEVDHVPNRHCQWMPFQVGQARAQADTPPQDQR